MPATRVLIRSRRHRRRDDINCRRLRVSDLEQILAADPGPAEISALNGSGPVESSDSRSQMQGTQHLRDGASFILDQPSSPPPMWGRDLEVLAARDEPTILVSPPGLGKTSILSQITLRLADIRSGLLLGYPVSRAEGRILFVAADRPAQIARSFARMVSEDDREQLATRLVVHVGPLPFDPSREPDAVIPYLRGVGGVSHLIIDSFSAVASDLAKDEAGLAIRRCLDLVSAEGVQSLYGHHDRKKDQAGSGRVRTLDDVYGSRWITAAAGSVLYLDGNPGDLVVKMRHLKQPAAEVGPLELVHDHDLGTTTLADNSEGDPLAIVTASPSGATVREVASSMFGATDPDRNQIEKARRRLDRLVGNGKLAVSKGSTQADATVYRKVPA